MESGSDRTTSAPKARMQVQHGSSAQSPLSPHGSWIASTIPASGIGTMNPIVLVLVLVLVLETKLAGRGRVRERGRGRRDGSWKASTIPASRIGTMNPIVLVLVLVLVLETKLARSRPSPRTRTRTKRRLTERRDDVLGAHQGHEPQQPT